MGIDQMGINQLWQADLLHSSPSVPEQKRVRFTCTCGWVDSFSYRFSSLTATYPAMYRIALFSRMVSGATASLLVLLSCSTASALFLIIFFRTLSTSNCSASWDSTRNGSGTNSVTKEFQILLTASLFLSLWKLLHTQACAAEGSLNLFPETIQLWSLVTRYTAMSVTHTSSHVFSMYTPHFSKSESLRCLQKELYAIVPLQLLKCDRPVHGCWKADRSKKEIQI